MQLLPTRGRSGRAWSRRCISSFRVEMAKMKEEMRTDMVKDLERREAELREEMAGQLEKMETHIGRMCRLESFKCDMIYVHRWRRVMLSFQDTIHASRNVASLHRDQKTGECEGSYVIIILK